MTHAQTACPETPLAFRRAKANDRGPSLADRLRALYARIASGFEDHGEYFAEMEGALSPHVRERRQARRHRDRLALFAALGR